MTILDCLLIELRSRAITNNQWVFCTFFFFFYIFLKRKLYTQDDLDQWQSSHSINLYKFVFRHLFTSTVCFHETHKQYWMLTSHSFGAANSPLKASLPIASTIFHMFTTFLRVSTRMLRVELVCVYIYLSIYIKAT